MKALFLVACVVLVLCLWAIIALAVALAPYMFGLVAFLAALWLVVWVGSAVLAVIVGAFARNGRQ